jgi:DNA-binding FrmR family transcriptional regulator
MADKRQDEILEKATPGLLSRLRRIEGQARGLQRMIEDKRDCQEVVTQVAALKAAVEQVGVTVVGCLLETAIRQAVETGTDTELAVEAAKKMLGKI